MSLPRRPESDRRLDASIALRAVREQVPTLGAKAARLLGSGWGNDVYLVDHRSAARFPRNAEAATGVDRDQAVLRLVASELQGSFAVPTVRHRGKAGSFFPYDFLVCDLVAGISADDPQAPPFSELTADLGNALTRIHSVPVDAAREAGLPSAPTPRGVIGILALENNRDIIRQMFAPVSEALIDDAGSAPGHSVLDVGTGPGEPALRIAELVGSHGEVVGIDPVAGMIELSRRAAERLSLTKARFETAGADSLPFPDDRFDASGGRSQPFRSM